MIDAFSQGRAQLKVIVIRSPVWCKLELRGIKQRNVAEIRISSKTTEFCVLGPVLNGYTSPMRIEGFCINETCGT